MNLDLPIRGTFHFSQFFALEKDIQRTLDGGALDSL